MDRAELRWLRSGEAGDWIDWDDWRSGPMRVSCLVPSGFDATARVLHPMGFEGRRATWRELADLSGVPFHPTVHVSALLAGAVGRPEGNWVYSGQPLCITDETWEPLLQALVPWTASSHVILGYSTIPREWRSDEERFHNDGSRSWDLAEAHVDWVAEPSRVRDDHMMPGLAWAGDRSWFFHSEYEDLSTYVAGSEPAIQALLTAPGLEVVRVSRDDPAPTP